MKVLLIGGTGIISTDIAVLAAQRDDIDLYLLNRGSLPQFVPSGVNVLCADINDAETVLDRLGDLSFDVVADFISYTPAALARKLDIFRHRCGQYIFISSVAAYRQPACFRVQTESAASIGNPLWSYGLNKALCERALAAESEHSGLVYTIVRPAYTTNDIRILHPYTINHWRSWTVAQRALQQKPYVLQDDGQQLCTVMHASDFAKALVGLFGNEAAINEDFHITSSEYLTWKRIAELMCEALGTEPRFCFVPAQELCRHLGQAAGEKVMATTQHAVYDSAKVRQAVPEFACTTPFAEGIERTIRFYRDHPRYQRVDPQWDDAFDRIAESQP